MRHWKKGKRWQRRAAAVLAVLFLIMGIGKVLGAEVPKETGRYQWEELTAQSSQTWPKRLQERILWNAVNTISPVMGYVLSAEEEENLERLLLAEQNTSVSVDSAVVEGSQSSQPIDNVSLFPEDEDEILGDLTELDADLLAEIDRENEAMRLLAEQQAQAGQNGVGTGQNNGDGINQDNGEDTMQTATQTLVLPYSMEQLNSLDFLVTNLYNVHKTTRVSSDLLNVSAMLDQDMELQHPDSGGPKILIHHTHATEYFADSDEKNEATLIVGVGDYLEELLESQYGIEVIHDRTVYPYNEAYSQALKNVEKILEENPTIEVFIDLHRDAGGTKKYTVDVNGKETANLMFFNGLSYNVNGPIDYLVNDNLEENLAFSFQLKMAGDSLYPGLCKRNYLKAYRYNLHVLPRAVIVEVGDNNNTLQEAKNAMEPLARILNYVLTGKSESR